MVTQSVTMRRYYLRPVSSLPSASGGFPWYGPLASLSLQVASMVLDDHHAINNTGSKLLDEGRELITNMTSFV